MRKLLPIVLLLALLAGCGSTAKAPKKAASPCPAAVRSEAKLRADIAAIRKAALTTPAESPAVNHATDRFLADVATAPIGNLRRNRLIDHAMGALAGSCEQCFQALEAGRPVVTIRYSGGKACK